MSRDYQSGNRVIRVEDETLPTVQAVIVWDADPAVIGVALPLTQAELGSCYVPYTGGSPVLDPGLSTSAAPLPILGGP